ncbi:MAG: response regulator transcription factor [Sphingobacteriales bacterium]|nr:MAG: response regulator transcription factor [Sphingobacteriales bacterium]
MTKPIRVLLVDDHVIFRAGIGALLQRKFPLEVEIVGEASDGIEALELSKQLLPDIVLMDLQMPRMDGIAATREIRSALPKNVRVIGISTYNENTVIEMMFEAGARGFLLKHSSPDDLIRALRTVHQGGLYIIQDGGETAQLDVHVPNPNKAIIEKLSDREREVIGLLCEELSTKEIATRMNVSVRSVDTYRESIMKKIGVRNAVGIAVFAIRNGLA